MMNIEDFAARSAVVAKQIDATTPEEQPRMLKVLDECYNHIDVIVAENVTTRAKAAALAKQKSLNDKANADAAAVAKAAPPTIPAQKKGK